MFREILRKKGEKIIWNVQPSPEETELYNEAEEFRKEGIQILNELTNYKGNSDDLSHIKKIL